MLPKCSHDQYRFAPHLEYCWNKSRTLRGLFATNGRNTVETIVVPSPVRLDAQHAGPIDNGYIATMTTTTVAQNATPGFFGEVISTILAPWLANRQ
jgi:hypothetical protein